MGTLWGKYNYGPSSYGQGGYVVYLPATGLENATDIIEELVDDR